MDIYCGLLKATSHVLNHNNCLFFYIKFDFFVLPKLAYGAANCHNDQTNERTSERLNNWPLRTQTVSSDRPKPARKEAQPLLYILLLWLVAIKLQLIFIDKFSFLRFNVVVVSSTVLL